MGFLAAVLSLSAGCTEKDDFSVFSGPYLGQNLPGGEPELFMPGLISTHHINHCIGFLREGRVCVFSIWEKGTYYLYEKDGRWTQPEEAPWQNEPGPTDFTAGPDGNTIYFQSRRPTGPDDTEQENNTWKVEWTGNNWTEPVPLPYPANTDEYSEGYPSVTPDGTVYFFTSSRPDSRIADIYRTRRVGGEYLEAERLPAPINTDYYEVDPFVGPDGSFLLFGSARPGGYGLMDLYVSFSGEDGRWTNPINAGPELNPFGIPTRMSVTPDGKYYFFPSRHETDAPKGEEVVSSNIERWGDYDIYWIDTGFIDDLREGFLGKKSAAELAAAECMEQGIRSAAALLQELYGSQQDGHYFELSEFMVFCGELMTAGRSEEAEQIYAALLETLPEEARVRQGYAVTCLLNGRASEGTDLLKEMWARFPSAKTEELFMINFHLRRTSRKEDELAFLRFVVLEFPDSGLAHLNLAEALEHYGDQKEAYEHCTRALELNPALTDAVAMRERLAGSFFNLEDR